MTSWKTRPRYDPEPAATYKFEPGDGWKLFDITPLIRAQAKAGRPSHGILLGSHDTLAVKTIQALYYKAGKDRLLTIVLVRNLEGKRPDQMFYCTKLDWTAKEILSAYACRWAIECTFEYCKQFLGLEDPANRVRKAVERTAHMAMFIYSLVVVWFHQTGHQLVRFPFRPWYLKKEEPSFADMLTTLRLVSYDEKTEQLLPKQCALKTWITQTHRASQPDLSEDAIAPALSGYDFVSREGTGEWVNRRPVLLVVKASKPEKAQAK